MSTEHRITYDSASLMILLEQELDKFNVFQYDSRYQKLLGTHMTECIKHWDNLIRKQKDSPLTMVVCGEFKRGKSSFINALLGEDVVTTDVTTETITINQITYGTHSNEIVLSDGKRVHLSDEELHCDKLGAILENLPEKSRKLEIKRPLELLKSMTIIDTPGLGDAMEDFAEEVSDAISRADVIVYLFSVAYPISVQEQLFIRSVIKPQNFTEMFFVGSFADIMEDEEELERIQSVIQKRLGEILPEEKPLLISSLDERCRQLETKIPNEEISAVLAENFSKFRKKLEELLEEKRDCVIPDRIERMIRCMAEDIRGNIDSMIAGLNMDSEQIVAETEKVKEEQDKFVVQHQKLCSHIEKMTEELKADAIVWLEMFISNMEKDTENLSQYSAEDIKKYYSLFCIDAIQEAVTKCNEYFMISLFNELDKVSEDITKQLSYNRSSPLPKFTLSLSNKTWTKADTVAFATHKLPLLSAVSSFGIVSLAVNYFAGFSRQKNIEKSIPDLKKEILKQYPALKQSALKSLSQSFSVITEDTKKELDSYFDSCRQECSVQREQAVMVARKDEEYKEKIKQALDELSAVVTSIENRFSFHLQ